MEKAIKIDELPTSKIKKEKKFYSAPTIEAIHSIREVTKGSVINTSDAGGQGGANTNPPSDPG